MCYSQHKCTACRVVWPPPVTQFFANHLGLHLCVAGKNLISACLLCRCALVPVLENLLKLVTFLAR